MKVRPLLGSQASARQSLLTARAFPGGRQVQGKTRLVDRSAGQAAPGSSQPTYQSVDRYLGQAARKLAVIL